MKNLIIEGITGTGKSTIYNKVVNALNAYSGSNLLLLNEYLTWRVFEKEKNIQQACETTFSNIINFTTWTKASYLNANLQNTSCGHDEELFCLMEGFHWNAYARGILSEESFYCIEEQLKKLDFVIVLLILSEDQIENRSVIQTRKFRTSGWDKYLKTLGNSDDEIALIFKERQDEYYNIYSHSSLNKLIINTDEKKWDDYVERIIALGEKK